MVNFEKKGPQNTDAALELAVKRGRELGINNYVIASCSGETAQKIHLAGSNIVCVTHQAGFAQPGEDEMPGETRKLFQEKGIRVLTTTHLLGGVDRSLRMKFQGVYPAEIIASTLRMFGQGVKVCVEIAVMALDAGLLPYGEEIIAIGGTGEGADTAMVLIPAHSQNFFATNIKEIICAPRGY